MPNDAPTESTPDFASPLISVIMATYNRERFICAALESVLQQRYTPLEIIVVDDGSTDGTPGVIHTLREETAAPIHYIRQPNGGLPAAHNHGLRLARGQIIAFLDSDDLWPDGRLPAQLAYFTPPEPTIAGAPGIVLGRQQRFADSIRVNPAELDAVNRRPVHYSLGTSLFARWVFTQIGHFDETLRHNADWDWFVRAREAAITMAADPRVTLLVRVHGNNMTQDRKAEAHFIAQVVKKHLGRTRIS